MTPENPDTERRPTTGPARPIDEPTGARGLSRRARRRRRIHLTLGALSLVLLAAIVVTPLYTDFETLGRNLYVIAGAGLLIIILQFVSLLGLIAEPREGEPPLRRDKAPEALDYDAPWHGEAPE